MSHQQTRPLQDLHNKVPVSNGAQTVGVHRAEAEVPGHELAVNAKRVASERTHAQGASRHALLHTLEALQIALEESGVRQQPVREAHRLGALQMCVSRHQNGQCLLCALSADGEELLEGCSDVGQLLAGPQAHVDADLLVAGAARVKLAGGGTNQLAQPALIGRVDVLVRLGVDDELALLPLFLHLLQAANNLLKLLVGEDFELAQGLGPGDRAVDVSLVQHLVERERLVELEHEVVDCAWPLRVHLLAKLRK
jgi:hypothetical protein